MKLSQIMEGNSKIRIWIRTNDRLGIHHEMYSKGQPWRNLIESQFGIQARLGEYHWQRCKTIDEAVEFHRDLIRDHNRLPHWAHRLRNDRKDSPLEVLGNAKGQHVEPGNLQWAFGQRYCQRLTDSRGFVRMAGWKIYIEDGLPRTPVQLSYWGGKLRAEHQSQIITEYKCKWSNKSSRPVAIANPTYYHHPYESNQLTLFDPLFIRDPMKIDVSNFQRTVRETHREEQLHFNWGSNLLRIA